MDIAHFEQRLLARKRELNERLGRIETDLEQPADRDLEDQAIQRENDEVLEEMGDVGQKELAAIDAAIGRIRAGTYGTCPKCGGQISEARLEAVPHAALCEECISG
ncbi:TraR/DksA family transcriptional regulator [Gellertiella hungarica]|uniref:RNA polymerase-binding protein DksA n=1 Tax=Gellertiella hungarica TaxID=1572859 RepID=A0A7W6NIM4_9HYPH|nr:TraR/DksA C4-type zinc finger protein [Gellertiella hungarica]MBB4063515.1 RNA polymerase-binding protein DksA [Gellertiella hungarica]